MTSLLRSAILALVVPALAGCAEGPFVSTKYESIMPKPDATGRVRTSFEICHGDGATDREIWDLARQTCGDFRLQPELQRRLKWQCRMTAPHNVHFNCIDPDQPAAPAAIPALPPR